MSQEKEYRRITIDKDVYDQIEKFANEFGRSRKGVVQDAVVAYMRVLTSRRANDKRKCVTIKNNKKELKNVLLTARIDASIKEDLVAYCKKHRVSQTKVTIDALQVFMKKHENDYDIFEKEMAALLGGDYHDR